MINIDLNRLTISDVFKIQSIRDEVSGYINNPYLSEGSNDFYYNMTELDVYNGYGQKLTTLQILSDSDLEDFERQERLNFHEFDDFKSLMARCKPDEIQLFLASNGYYINNKEVSFTIEYITEDNPKIVFTKN